MESDESGAETGVSNAALPRERRPGTNGAARPTHPLALVEKEAPAKRVASPQETILHRPSAMTVERSQMTHFMRFCEKAASAPIRDDAALRLFSVENHRLFWRSLLEWSELDVEGSVEPVCVGDACETAIFFPELRLSFVQNVLAARTEEERLRPALTACTENGDRIVLSRAELTDRVLSLAAELRRRGLKGGDRVVAVASSSAEAVVACLAVTALGAIWSAASPDLGVESMVERFGQLEPTWLFFQSSYRYHGQGRLIADRIDELVRALPTVQSAVSLRGEHAASPPPGREVAMLVLERLIAAGDRATFPTLDSLPRFPFNHPLYILFSSGTTGRPKCIVHGAGGTLLEHVKEHRLHADLSPLDTLFFHTSTGWMMWNWQLSALASGVHVVLYDGSVSFPEENALWHLVERERVTVFGTSPSYLQFTRDAGLRPAACDLSALRSILSTGSVLPPAVHRWVYEHVKDVPLQSISGGTDILGCFLLGNPNLPVHEGELQSVSLGLDVRALGGNHASAISEDCVEFGELVCVNPFPSRPLGLFGDADGSQFHKAYFSQNPNVWTHGDLLELTARGGGRIHGRSDGVMNVRGIRIGPAEIYNVLESFPEIVESLAVEQAAPEEPGGSRLVLLIVLRPDQRLGSALVQRIRRELTERCSAAHAPSIIVDVPELPTTHSGKRSERAARDAVNGRAVLNVGALKNPESVRALREHPSLRLDEADGTHASGAHSLSLTPSQILVEAFGEVKVAGSLEVRLAGLWESVLGVPVGFDGDFFELGGHSLLAVTLLARVEKEFGVRLPMSSLFYAGTVTKMAALLHRGERPRAGLVEIQPGGAERPVFWLPGGGGLSVLAFREVSRRLGAERPVYGLEAELKLEGAPADVPTMARRYIRAIRARQPHGPYALFGFSLGGWVAYEIALQLTRAGEKVALLGVFDTAVPGVLSGVQQMSAVAQRLQHHWRNLRSLPAPDMWSYLGDTAEVIASRAQRTFTRFTRSSGEGTPATTRSVFDELDRRNRAMLEAYSQQVPAPYPGRITLFLAERTSQSGLSTDLDARLGWKRFARSGVDVHRVSGSHLSMLEPPDVDGLARTLRECLARADAVR